MAVDKKRPKRRKVSYLTLNKIEKLDYKDVIILRRFLTERGKILPRRVTGNTASQQRMLTKAVQQARTMALLPYVGTIEQERGERGDRDRGDRGRDRDHRGGDRDHRPSFHSGPRPSYGPPQQAPVGAPVQQAAAPVQQAPAAQ